MSEVSLNDLLFSLRAGRTLGISPGAALNTPLPNAPNTSSKRGTNASHPRISKLACILEDILEESKVSALGSDSGYIYCEYKTNSTTEYIYYDKVNMYSSGNDTSSALSAIFLSVIAMNNADFLETYKSVNEAIHEFVTNRIITSSALAYACDCFYYDTKDIISNINKSTFDANTKIMIQQAVDTGLLKPISNPETDIEPFLKTDFEGISFTQSTAASNPFANTAKEFLKKCLNSELKINFEWTIEQQKRIPPLSKLENFVPNEAFEVITSIAHCDLSEAQIRMSSGFSGAKAIGDNYTNVILVGKPGTGKTITVEAIAASLGLPIYSIPLSKNSEEDELQGKNKIVEGKIKFVETALLPAFENGGVVVLEEFNLADPAVLQGALGQAIEYPFTLLKDGYIEIQRHPLCVFVATMNTATQGAREPNEAFASRLPITILMDDPIEKEAIQMLVNHGFDVDSSKKVHRLYAKIIKYLKEEAGSETLSMCVTPRHCLGALKLMKMGKDLHYAIKNSLIGALAIKDLELARDVYENVVASTPNR